MAKVAELLADRRQRVVRNVTMRDALETAGAGSTIVWPRYYFCRKARTYIECLQIPWPK